MQLVDHDTFLKHLHKLFEAAKEKGSIWLTHKRLVHDGQDIAMKEGDDDSREYRCLIRVHHGHKSLYSTQVSTSELPQFYAAYGALLKASMGTLRKRDKKREKQRAEEAAKRKQKITEPIIVDGKKRGAGRRRRQRKVNAAIKQQTAIQRYKEREDRKTAKK